MESFVQYNHSICKSVPFIPPPYCRKAEEALSGNRQEPTSLKLAVSNPSKILLLCETLTDNSSKTVESKINNYLMQEADSKSCFLIHLKPSYDEIFIQTIGVQELEISKRVSLTEDAMKQIVYCENETLKCSEGFSTNFVPILKNIFENSSFKFVLVPILGKQKLYSCSSENVVPVLLVCFINSKKDEEFLTKLANDLFKFCLPVLSNIMAVEEERRKRQQYQGLLTVIHKLFFYLEDINKLINILKDESRKLLNAQKSTLYLKNPSDIDLILKILKEPNITQKSLNLESTSGHVIPDHVVNTGQLLKVQSIETGSCTDDNFQAQLEESKARDILCFPVRYQDDVIGAIQLCNKRDGKFTRFDEEIATILSYYYGLAITNGLKYTILENVRTRNQICNELFIYQIRVEEEEVNRIMSCPLIHSYTGFEDFDFCPRTIVQRESICFVMKMFEELNFFTKFPIRKEVFTRFVLHVRQGCRDVPYHNWMHLFSTAHFGYLCIKKLELITNNFITDMEAMTYFISCLCHDLGYNGTNNDFQDRCYTGFSSLYSSPGSVAERHRLSQIFRLLNNEGCNFLEEFDRTSYVLAVNLIKDMVLATDLVTHFKYCRRQLKMIKNGYDRNNAEHRYIFVSLLMTCADVSDHAKDWSLSRTVAEEMYEEFLILGSLEKDTMRNPAKMSDPENILFSDLQVEFLKQVCLPPFKLLAVIFSNFKDLVSKIKRNIIYWEASKHIFQKAYEEGQSLNDVLSDKNFDSDVESTVKLIGEK